MNESRHLIVRASHACSGLCTSGVYRWPWTPQDLRFSRLLLLKLTALCSPEVLSPKLVLTGEVMCSLIDRDLGAALQTHLLVCTSQSGPAGELTPSGVPSVMCCLM